MQRGVVRVGFNAPRDVRVDREEIRERIEHESDMRLDLSTIAQSD